MDSPPHYSANVCKINITQYCCAFFSASTEKRSLLFSCIASNSASTSEKNK